MAPPNVSIPEPPFGSEFRHLDAVLSVSGRAILERASCRVERDTGFGPPELPIGKTYIIRPLIYPVRKCFDDYEPRSARAGRYTEGSIPSSLNFRYTARGVSSIASATCSTFPWDRRNACSR